MNKMITIITAAWNLDGLKKTIESVNNQTYTNWNHIIVNDNQPEIRKYLDELCDGQKRFWIDFGFRTHYYGGLARNVGAIVSFSYVHHLKRDIDNEWVIFHDDDNLWEPNHLESMVNVITKNPSAVMVASDIKLVGRTNKNWTQIRKCQFVHGRCDLGQFMYKTKLFRDYGYFFPHPRHKHKWDWELIKKIYEGEKDNIFLTNQPTFIMNYKRK
jgi:glycosyltransferase involved in cell wall biosynthesis